MKNMFLKYKKCILFKARTRRHVRRERKLQLILLDVFSQVNCVSLVFLLWGERILFRSQEQRFGSKGAELGIMKENIPSDVHSLECG